MAYLRRVNGLFVFSSSFGMADGGPSGELRATVWVFSGGLVVTPASQRWPLLPARPLRRIEQSGTPTPASIQVAFPAAVRLDHEEVVRVSLEDPGTFHRVWARFEATGQDVDFILLTPRRRVDEVDTLLRGLYRRQFVNTLGR